MQVRHVSKSSENKAQMWLSTRLRPHTWAIWTKYVCLSSIEDEGDLTILLVQYEITGKLLNEVKSCGGKGLADNHTADDLSLTMDMAVKLFGSIDVVIYNVELARQDGGNVFNAQGLNCHLKNAYKVCNLSQTSRLMLMKQCIQAVWSHQRRQKHGKVIMTCSIFDGTDNSEHILYNSKLWLH